jgi:hypothetical protein
MRGIFIADSHCAIRSRETGAGSAVKVSAAIVTL